MIFVKYIFIDYIHEKENKVSQNNFHQIISNEVNKRNFKSLSKLILQFFMVCLLNIPSVSLCFNYKYS